MCNIICDNSKCNKRLSNGFCSRAYPCSEFQCPQFELDTLKAAKLSEQDNLVSLKDLYYKEFE